MQSQEICLPRAGARSSLNQPDAARLAVAGPEAQAQGAPLLPAADFPYDLVPARPLWDELCALLASLQGSPAEAVQALRRETAADEMLPDKAFAAFMQNNEAFFSAWAERLPQAPALVHFLAQAVLTPQLAAVTDALAAARDDRRVWDSDFLKSLFTFILFFL